MFRRSSCRGKNNIARANDQERLSHNDVTVARVRGKAGHCWCWSVMARWFVTVDGAHVGRVIRGAVPTRRVGDEASLKGWSGDNTRFRTSTAERVHVQHFSRSARGAIKFSNAERVGRMWERLRMLSRRYCWINRPGSLVARSYHFFNTTYTEPWSYRIF